MSELERAELIVACMQERGVAVEVDSQAFPPGGITYDNRIVTDEQFDTAYDACVDELTQAGALPQVPPPSPEVLEARFDDLLTAAECIERLGYEVPNPPTREVFVDSRGAAWDPYEIIAEELGFQVVSDVYAQCGP